MGTESEIEIGSVPEKETMGMPENEMGSLQGLQMQDERVHGSMSF